jgi:hypothetical protein
VSGTRVITEAIHIISRTYKNLFSLPIQKFLNPTLLYAMDAQPKITALQFQPTYIYSKGKAVPLQAWGGPEGSRKLRFPDFLTTAAQDDGKVVSHKHRPHLTPGNSSGTHFC